jgi:hypothetical protein
MKIGWKAIAGGIAATVVLFGAYSAWDITRYRTAEYECSEGPKTITLTSSVAGRYPWGGEFYLTGRVDRGELTVAGFPGAGERPLRFAPGATISEAYKSEWYDSEAVVRFEPSPESVSAEFGGCYVRIVYRFNGTLFSMLMF